MAYAVWHGLAADESSSDLVVLASPDVTVTDRSDGSKASLFADRAGNTALANPFTANADGSITFYAPPGRYKIEATKSGNTVTWDNVLIGAPHGMDSRTDRAVPMYDAANKQFVPATDLGAPASITDSGTDAYQGDFGRDVSDGEIVTGDVGSANTTTTPTLENTGGTPSALTITTKDGSALWANALDGVHTFQRNGSTSWLVLDPRWQMAPFWAGHIDGLELSNNSTDSDHDIDIATGVCAMRDGAGNRKLFELTSTLTKQIDANWAEGTGAGGFPSGLTLGADTHYNVFVIGQDDGSIDAGFDTDASASNLLSDASSYSWFRRVGSVFTDGSSNIRGFHQEGDTFLYKTLITDINDSSLSDNTAETGTLTVPSRQIAHITFRGDASAATQVNVQLINKLTDIVTLVAQQVDGDADSKKVISAGVIAVDANSQVEYKGAIGGAGSESLDLIKINTSGWTDDRGRNA